MLLCGLLFFALYNGADYFLTNYFEQSDFMEARTQKQGENLQKYISENKISSKELQKLKKWEFRQPLILLDHDAADEWNLYRRADGKCF